MSKDTSRVFILGNPEKAGVSDAVTSIQETLAGRFEVVGTALSLDGQVAVEAGADQIVVLGGDGTLLAVCRSLGSGQIPLVGVNFGKFGFLAEFSIEEFKDQFAAILGPGRHVSERMILAVSVTSGGGECFRSLAVNDCVVHAGSPFRIIQLAIRIDDVHLTNIAGDGLIVCSPVGSTAHNMSAGGPIMQPGVSGIALTPLCPHSLTHRPLVVESEARIEIEAIRTNPGTSVMVDGQLGCPMSTGDRVSIGRSEFNLQIVRNPQYPRWHRLVSKLRWGQPPSYHV